MLLRCILNTLRGECTVEDVLAALEEHKKLFSENKSITEDMLDSAEELTPIEKPLEKDPCVI